MLLCELQGDTGAAVVFFAMFVVMSLAAHVKLRYFAVLGGLVLIAIPILWQFVMDEYQKARIVALFNLDNVEVQANEGYQQYQGMISIGSGKFSGQGLFQGSRVASNSVPFQQSDYIFSVAGEELGFIGCSLILLLLFLLLVKILHVAHSSRDDLGKYICFGYFGIIALQSISNIGMCLALLPVMGVTLPFFSAGAAETENAPALYLQPGEKQLNLPCENRPLESPPGDGFCYTCLCVLTAGDYALRHSRPAAVGSSSTVSPAARESAALAPWQETSPR